MSNPYFVHTNRLIRYSLARAEQVNAIADSIAEGFGLLPTPSQLYLGNAQYQVDTGVAANVYAVTVPVGLTGYVAGMTVLLRPNNTNTGASTLNVNGLGPVAIRPFTGSDDIPAGSIVANELATLIYDDDANVFRFTNIGAKGDNGWSPILAVQNDGERRVLRVVDWTGGIGTKPASGQYIGASGLVASIGDAVNIRGAAGAPGSGSGDMQAANNLSDLTSASTALTNLGANTVGAGIFTLANPGAIRFLRVNANNSTTLRSASEFRSDLATTVGANLMNLTNPGAVRFIRLNADNTVTARSNTEMTTDLGATTAGANIFRLANPGTVSFVRINSDNTVSSRTPTQLLDDVGATTAGRNLLALPNPNAIRFLRVNANNTVTARQASDFRTDIGATTVGSSFFTLANPSAISFVRINANNTVSARTPSQLLDDVGATEVGKALLTQSTPGAVRFLRVNADGSVTQISASNFLLAVGATTVGRNIFELSNPSAIRFIRINADNTVSARTGAELLEDIGVTQTTTSLSATSWIGGGSARCIRIGGMVFVSFIVNFTSGTGTIANAGTIPAGFRPSLTNEATSTVNPAGEVMSFSVATSGVISANKVTGASGGFVVITLSYPGA